ncbi:sensor histidine kinase [Calidifontibacter indicus]|uniref:sensor histidine kinase n=1 Tax=Calidifontibacter indicus TaxID=419650 RepID=UPI0014731C72|nr:histidine kinase [Calidifontibacter indicus]
MPPILNVVPRATVTRRAVAVGLVCAAVAGPFVALGLGWTSYVDGWVGILLAVAAAHVAGAWLPRSVAVACVLTTVVALVVAGQVHGVAFHWVDDTAFYAVVIGGAAVAGAAVTTRARQVHRLQRLQAELAEQHEMEARLATLDEQNRVHLEVHTRLSERIAGIAVRAEGARRVADRTALPVIEAEARAVLDELRHVLGSMRASVPEAPPEPSPPPGPARPTVLDVALTVAIGTALAAETAVIARTEGAAISNAAAAVVAAAPLVLRRSRPIASGMASMVVAGATSPWLTPLSSTVAGVALVGVIAYTVGAWSDGRRWLPGWAAVAAGSAGIGLLAPGQLEPEALVGVIALTLVALVLGLLTAQWRTRAQRLAEAVAELTRGRDAALRLVTAREREAMAGRLHDTVAHSMTVVCLHAGAATRADVEVGDALRTVSTTAEASLAELRDGIEGFETAKHPLEAGRIAALGRRMGVDVSTSGCSADGAAATLGYRVVREAVVNVARHAPGARAAVDLRRDGDVLTVQVSDDGRTLAATGAGTGPSAALAAGAAAALAAGAERLGTGTGLLGLARAVETAGGSMSWGTRAGGGYVVTARIPESPTR